MAIMGWSRQDTQQITHSNHNPTSPKMYKCYVQVYENVIKQVALKVVYWVTKFLVPCLLSYLPDIVSGLQPFHFTIDSFSKCVLLAIFRSININCDRALKTKY